MVSTVNYHLFAGICRFCLLTLNTKASLLKPCNITGVILIQSKFIIKKSDLDLLILILKKEMRTNDFIKLFLD